MLIDILSPAPFARPCRDHHRRRLCRCEWTPRV